MSFDPTATYLGESIKYPRERLEPPHYISGGFQAERKVRVTWAERYSIAIDYLDNTTTYPYFTKAGITNTCFVSAVAIEPDSESRLTCGNDSTGEAVYTHAWLTLDYRPAALSGGVALIEEVRPRVEMVSLPKLTGKFTFADKTPCTPSPIYAPGFSLRITYPRLTVVPNSVLLLPGHLNSDYFVPRLFSSMILSPGTLLHLTPALVATAYYNGSWRYSVSHELFWRPVDWNMEPNPTSYAMEYAYDSKGNKLAKYPYMQFTGSL